MAAVSASPERIDLSRPMMMERDSTKSDVASSPASSVASSANDSCSSSTPDRDDLSNSSPNPNREAEIQSLSSLRSEEYRQLFRLPSEEVLLQDFNCAYQESILLQGHMYLFIHHICFYSNIFGFETKKIIPFFEVTSVKRAKTAGIFPNAIEIFAGGRKYFFASFLSRDEAFNLINDGWSQHGIDAKEVTEEQALLTQDPIADSSIQETGLGIEKVNSSSCVSNESEVNRDKDALIVKDPKLVENNEADVAIPLLERGDNAEQQAELAVVVESSSAASAKTWTWKLESSDAPMLPEGYTKVAEKKFLVKVEEFFDLFFSDDAKGFIESFHTRCKDKEFRSTAWYPHDEFGHARDVSFQHPIKIYFGAKFGSCREVQKFRVYQNSHLIFETAQEIDDVPYGDYFTVKALWDLQRDNSKSKEGCILQVYINVTFKKSTVWKGKIVQSTVEECREAYGIWVDMANEIVKQKNLEKREESIPPVNLTQNSELEGDVKTGECSERRNESSNNSRTPEMSDTMDVGNLVQANMINATSLTSLLRACLVKSYSMLTTQSRITLVLAIAFAVILLMQVTILMLLNRPQHVHMASPAYYSSRMSSSETKGEAIAWIEKRMHYLKDEMLMVESRLERMWHEHATLKAQLRDLERK